MLIKLHYIHKYIGIFFSPILASVYSIFRQSSKVAEEMIYDAEYLQGLYVCVCMYINVDTLIQT
jgi:hypothetical protein